MDKKKFVVGEKYSVTYNDGRTRVFKFIGGPTLMVSFEDGDGSLVDLNSATSNFTNIAKL